MEDTLTTVSGIIRDMFDEYDGPISRSLTATEVAQWDSLAHVQLIVAIERACRIRFNSGEIRNFENLGELIDAVDRKKSSA